MFTITRITKFPALLALAVSLAAPAPVRAQGSYEALHTFSANKGRPLGAPVQGLDGRLYGTTIAGGSLGKGSVYATDAAGTTTTIHEFNGQDGEGPRGSLMRASDDAIYGTTAAGGSGFGTVFRIAKDGTFQTVAQFDGTIGSAPEGGLIEVNGAFYGTLRFGGAGHGAIFKMTSAGIVTALVTFDGTNGAFPTGSLIHAADGKLYGTTRRGGASGPDGQGTLFSVTLEGVLETLASFEGANGAVPTDAPIQASNGDFYGTTSRGGEPGLCPRQDPDSCGTIYRFSAAGLETLRSFSESDGALPMGALRQIGDQIYGSTQEGGYGGGTIFRLSLVDGSFETAASFSGLDGLFPASGVIEAANGAIYGTTEAGGPLNYGTFFELMPGDAIRTAVLFTGAEGAEPSGLTQGADGNFYGTTYIGGEHGFGTLFRMNGAGEVTTIYSFDGGANGSSPSGGLLLASDGAIYGTTEAAGATGDGTVFRINVDGSVETVASFDFLTNGSGPLGGLIEGSDGHLYGTVLFGKATIDSPDAPPVPAPGGIFRVNRTTKAIEEVATLAIDGSQGDFLSSGVVQAPNGDLYATAEMGGANSAGAVVRWSPATRELTAFSFDGIELSAPAARLLAAKDGKLYGTATGGGANGNGALFRMSLDGALEPLASFVGLNGAFPHQQGVIEVSDGVFVGSTTLGGLHDMGTVYQWSADAGLTVLHDFDGAAVDGPNATLIKAADGALYGASAGPLGGAIYRVILRSDDTPPVLQLPGNLVVNATAPNGAKVTYTVTATDDSGEPVTITCSPASGSIFPIGTTTVNCTATDASGNVSQGSFTVKVLGAAQQIANLIEKIRKMPLPTTIKNALISILQKALSYPGGSQLICDFLKNLISVAKLKVPAALAAEISADATRIRAVIGCS
jgi:uncharacterized repeat protein (TIGR03803 family)